jgi:hypothetical protein
LVWKDLSQDFIAELRKLETPREKHDFLSNILMPRDDPRGGCMLDFHFYTYSFAEEAGFNEEQTSALFSLMKVVLEYARGESGTTWRPFVETWGYFKEQVRVSE